MLFGYTNIESNNTNNNNNRSPPNTMKSPSISKSPSYNFGLPIQNEVISYNQIHENDEAQIVILNEPSLAQWMGSIHPNGSLYEEPLDLSKAQEEHLKFRQLLEKEGCTVYTVREILTGSFDQKRNEDITHRVRLEDFAFNSITYELDSQQDELELGEKDKQLISDEYKQKCIDSMSVEQLVEVILTRPTIKLRKSERDTELLATEYTFKPLVNLVFQRDQQITTAKGIVMASLSSPIRAPEVEVMKLCFNLLGLPIVGEIPSPGKLEGGDFYPAGSDLCYIGVGLRSNFYAVQYLMDNDLLGTNRVAVVKDYFDLNQQRMHLDTVCNIINEKVMLILEDICGEQSTIKRLVDEYKKDSNGKYQLVQHDIEFSKYLVQQGFDLVKVTDQNQKDYGCNGLNIGNGKFIVVDKATAKAIARKSNTSSQLLFVDFRTVTKMYGSVHCCSQVVSRRSNQLSIDTTLIQSPPQPETTTVNEKNSKILMVAPTYFVKARIGSELINSSVIRDTRQSVLSDYSRLHTLLRESGINIHLFCHEPYHHTDQAVFVSEWFSTHSKEELGGGNQKDTLVLYPLENLDKRRERRRDILKYALFKYTRVIDLTSCESGVLEARETTVQDFIDQKTPTCNTPRDKINQVKSNGFYLDFSGIVLDRSNRIAYCSVDDQKYSSAVADLWANKLGYQLVKVKSTISANSFLAIGSKFAIFCPDALLQANDRDSIMKQLKESGKLIVTITLEQMKSFCAKVIELTGNNDEKILIMSDKCYQQFNESQIKLLNQSVDKIIHTDMSHLEEMGGNGMIGMIGILK
eukprot:gene7952-9782_t